VEVGVRFCGVVGVIGVATCLLYLTSTELFVFLSLSLGSGEWTSVGHSGNECVPIKL